MKTTKVVKELVSEYVYTELGFPVLLKDVPIVEDRGHEYPLINHNSIMFQVAYSLVLGHQKLDGARLKFIRRFMSKSLDQFAVIVGDTSKSSIHSWEKEPQKICPLTNEQIKRILVSLKTEIVNELVKKMDMALIGDISDDNEISPLSIENTSLVAM